MGFLDSLQSSVNRGMAATGRATSTMKLKAQMSEALKRRQALAAQLGASLYDVTKDAAHLRAGRSMTASPRATPSAPSARWRSSASRRSPPLPRPRTPTMCVPSAALMS